MKDFLFAAPPVPRERARKIMARRLSRGGAGRNRRLRALPLVRPRRNGAAPRQFKTPGADNRPARTGSGPVCIPAATLALPSRRREGQRAPDLIGDYALATSKRSPAKAGVQKDRALVPFGQVADPRRKPGSSQHGAMAHGPRLSPGNSLSPCSEDIHASLNRGAAGWARPTVQESLASPAQPR
mgnify:CR=1 FL=1